MDREIQYIYIYTSPVRVAISKLTKLNIKCIQTDTNQQVLTQGNTERKTYTIMSPALKHRIHRHCTAMLPPTVQIIDNKWSAEIGEWQIIAHFAVIISSVVDVIVHFTLIIARWNDAFIIQSWSGIDTECDEDTANKSTPHIITYRADHDYLAPNILWPPLCCGHKMRPTSLQSGQWIRNWSRDQWNPYYHPSHRFGLRCHCRVPAPVGRSGYIPSTPSSFRMKPHTLRSPTPKPVWAGSPTAK